MVAMNYSLMPEVVIAQEEQSEHPDPSEQGAPVQNRGWMPPVGGHIVSQTSDFGMTVQLSPISRPFGACWTARARRCANCPSAPPNLLDERAGEGLLA